MFCSQIRKELENTTRGLAQAQAQLTALDRSMARIEFAPDGTIIDANEIFLKTMGYTLPEIVNRHHRIFCTPELVESSAYTDHWQALSRGEYLSGRYERRHKNGGPVWIEALYSPVFGPDGKVATVIKYAFDITRTTLEAIRSKALMEAIEKSMAVIEFKPDGTIITANQNFLSAVGYSLKEITGRHHSMFCPDSIVHDGEYTRFWQRLARGESFSGKFERIAKGGRTLWLEASYSPIRDESGEVIGVVKVAADITRSIEQIEFEVNNADRALAIAHAAADGAIDGGKVISAATARMQSIASSASAALDSIAELETQSSQITSIAQTIREIADQTNLLALNAAIEAARAGEQGRGFAVVADEVRKLAERTSNATSDISHKIQQVQNGTRTAIKAMHETSARAGESVALAEQASQAMTSIESNSLQVVEVVTGLSAALKKG